MGNEEMCLSAVYKKPASKLDTFDVNSILDSPLSSIIAGDLNAKYLLWNSSRTNYTGNSLEQYLALRNDTTIMALTTPTNYSDNPNHNVDVLDVAIMKSGSLQYNLENLNSELSSDHTPIIIGIQAKTSRIPPPTPLRNVDWANFENDIAQTIHINPNTNTTDKIDAVIKQLTATIFPISSKKHDIFHTYESKDRFPKKHKKTNRPQKKTLSGREPGTQMPKQLSTTKHKKSETCFTHFTTKTGSNF